MKKKSYVYSVIFMIGITAFFTFILSLLNETTLETIKLHEDNKVRKSILYVFDIKIENNNAKNIKDTFDKYITKKEVKDKEIFIAKREGNIIGYAFMMEGNALWGSVKGYMAVSKDLNEILGVDFVSHSETPGLGGRIDEPWFKDQFRNINIDKGEKDSIVFRPSEKGNVDGITGATLTSVSVKNMINEDLYNFISQVEGGDLVE